MKFLHKITILFTALLLLGCSKTSPALEGQVQEPVQTGAYACADGCEPADLLHYPAVAETADKIGNVEFWECPHCGRAYTDAQGQHPLKGYAYLLPTGFLKDVSPLGALAMKAPQTKGGVVSSVELAMSIVSLCAGIASLCVSITALCESAEEVESAYEDLESSAYRTEAEIEQMNQYYAQIESSIDELMAKTTELNSSLQTMNASMTELNTTLVEVDKTLAQLIAAIKELVDDVRANLIIDNRHLLQTSLQHPIDDCFSSLSEYLVSDMAELNSAATFKDTLGVFRTFVNHQTGLIDEWALAENDRVADVMTLISTFNSVSYNYRENIPVFLEQYASHHFAWEHHAFTFRQAYLNKDRYLMSMGYYLSKMFFSLNGDIDKVYAQKRLELMTEQFEQTKILYAQDSVEIAAAYDKRRLCYVNGKSYEIDVHLLPFREYCDLAFPTSETGWGYDRPEYLCMMYDMPQESSIGREDVELMERFYFGEAKTIDELYFGEGVGGPHMRRSDLSADPYIVVPYATDKLASYSIGGHYEGRDYYYDYHFCGYFHNPFASEFLTKTDYCFLRVNKSHSSVTNWLSYPVCFTPIYKTEQ